MNQVPPPGTSPEEFQEQMAIAAECERQRVALYEVAGKALNDASNAIKDAGGELQLPAQVAAVTDILAQLIASASPEMRDVVLCTVMGRLGQMTLYFVPQVEAARAREAGAMN